MGNAQLVADQEVAHFDPNDPTNADPSASSPPPPNLEEVQAEATSMGIRRKAIQDSWGEGGNLMDVKNRALEIFSVFGIGNWGKDDDSFLVKMIRGYRTKTEDFPDKPAQSPPSEQLEEEPEDATEEFNGSVSTCISSFKQNPESVRVVKIYSKSKKLWYENSKLEPTTFKKMSTQQAEEGVKMETCIVMFDEYPESQGIKCPSGCFISRMALNHYIKTENAKEFEEIYARKGKILCPRVIMGECTSEPYNEVLIARMVDMDVFEQYMSNAKRCLYQEAFEEISEKVELLQRKNNVLETEMMEEQVRLQFKKPDGTFGGFQCPDCKFGPIDHRDCNDLRAHHEQRSGAAVISNACPMCGFFTPKLAEWNKWDGTFLRLNDAQREAVREKWRLNRKEKAELDALIKKISDRMRNYHSQWSSMRSQLVDRVNELKTRRQFLLTYVSRVTERAHMKVDINISGEEYKKVTEEFDQKMKMIESFITTLEEQLAQIKGGELWKVGGFLSLLTNQMNTYRNTVLNEEDEPTRRKHFEEMIKAISDLNTDVTRFVNYLKLSNVTGWIASIATERLRSHQKAEAIMAKLRMMIDEEAGELVQVVEDAYGSFLAGFGSNSDDEDGPLTPDTPALEENYQLDEFGEIIPQGKALDPSKLQRPKMTVQQSREKSHTLRESIEDYEKRYDEIQGIYVEYLMEDGKLEEEEIEKFSETLVTLMNGMDEQGEMTQELELEGILEYLKARKEAEEARVDERTSTLMKLRTDIEIEIVRMHHPEANVCEAVIVVRKFIGPARDINGMYVLQNDMHNGRFYYINDSGARIKFIDRWDYNARGEKVENPDQNGAWIIESKSSGLIVAALPEDVVNPANANHSWTSRNGLGQIIKNPRLEVQYGIVYLEKEKEENVQAKVDGEEEELADKQVDVVVSPPV